MKNFFIALVAVFGVFLAGCGSVSPEDQAVIDAAFQSGKYFDYTSDNFAQLKGNKKFVAFFYADWCGTCRNWEMRLAKGIETLPAEAVVLKVDYDKEAALAKELGVNKQSAAVFFNADGSIAEQAMDPSLGKIAEFFGQAPQAAETGVIVSTETDPALTATSGAQYAAFDAETFAAKDGSAKVALFFRADWCPKCKALDAQLTENIASFPPSTAIYHVNYDTATDLKARFEVTNQTTVVVLDETGAVVFKEVNPDFETLKAQF